VNKNTRTTHANVEPGAQLDPTWKRLLMHPAFVPVCLLAGLTLRLLTALLFPVEPFSDFAWYVSRALELAAGRGYQEGGYPTAYWPVGWPGILALSYKLLGSIPITVVVLNTIAALTIMVCILWLGRHVTANEAAARLALLGYTLYPNHIAYSGTAATELAYTALAMAAFVLMLRGRKRPWLLVLSGLLFGIATLVKPQTLAFPFGAVIVMMVVYRSWGWGNAVRAGLIIYLALFLTVAPWTYRNYQVLGEPVLVSTNGGTALFLGANDRMSGGDYAYQDTPEFQALGIPWAQRVIRQVELNKLEKASAIAWIKEHPGTYLAWMPKKVVMLWTKDTDGFWSFDYSFPNGTQAIRAMQILNQAYYILVLLLALVALGLALKALFRNEHDRLPLLLLFCMPVFVSLLAAAFTGQIRYHFPAMPFLFVAAAWSLTQITQRRRTTTSRVACEHEV